MDTGSIDTSRPKVSDLFKTKGKTQEAFLLYLGTQDNISKWWSRYHAGKKSGHYDGSFKITKEHINTNCWDKFYRKGKLPPTSGKDHLPRELQVIVKDHVISFLGITSSEFDQHWPYIPYADSSRDDSVIRGMSSTQVFEYLDYAVPTHSTLHIISGDTPEFTADKDYSSALTYGNCCNSLLKIKWYLSDSTSESGKNEYNEFLTELRILLDNPDALRSKYEFWHDTLANTPNANSQEYAARMRQYSNSMYKHLSENFLFCWHGIPLFPHANTPAEIVAVTEPDENGCDKLTAAFMYVQALNPETVTALFEKKNDDSCDDKSYHSLWIPLADLTTIQNFLNKDHIFKRADEAPLLEEN